MYFMMQDYTFAISSHYINMI